MQDEGKLKGPPCLARKGFLHGQDARDGCLGKGTPRRQWHSPRGTSARFFADSEALYSYEGTREMNTLIVGKAITGFNAFV